MRTSHNRTVLSELADASVRPGPPGEIRAERDAPDRRIAELDRETPTVRDELAERQVAEQPAWAREMLGTSR